MSNTVQDHLFHSFQSAAERFRNDFDALDHDDLDRKWGDSCRRAYDVVYEVSLLNERTAAKLRGEELGPMPWKFGEEWLEAPDAMRDKAAAARFFDETAKGLLAAAKAHAENADDEEALAVAKSLIFAALHTSYHDAQLNFIQSLKGDLAIHW